MKRLEPTKPHFSTGSTIFQNGRRQQRIFNRKEHKERKEVPPRLSYSSLRTFAFSALNS
jgi:hypothetical protein